MDRWMFGLACVGLGWSGGGCMAADDDATVYEVWIRDALPFEDALGLVPSPTPCNDGCPIPGATCEDGHCQGPACTDACDPLTPCVAGECIHP